MTHQMSASPASLFDTNQFPVGERVDACSAFHSQTIAAQPYDAAARAGFRISGEGWRLGSVILGRVTQFNAKLSVVPGQTESLLPEMLVVRIYQQGEHLGSIDDAPLLLRPGAVHVFPLRYTLITPYRTSFVTCVMPCTAVGYDRAVHPPHITIPSQHSVGGMLSTFVLAAADTAASLSRPLADAAGEAIVGLLRAILARWGETELEDPDELTARARCVRLFLRTRVAARQLSVREVCETFHISRSTLYRMFEADGGFRRFMRSAALNEAFRQLKSPNAPPVADIAQRWGFHEPAHFSRMFKNQFGLTARDVRDLAVFEQQVRSSSPFTQTSYSDTNPLALMNLYDEAGVSFKKGL